MARTIYGHVEVGRKVYLVFRPLNAGVIIEVLPQATRTVNSVGGNEYTYTPPPNARVRWLNGTVTEVPSGALSDFDALIQDHEKKLSTHLATRAKLEAMAQQLGACTRPPEGWSCSREPGHEGPCAARPIRLSKPGHEGTYWCCEADFGKHENECPNYSEEAHAS
jgi:hypothetical protein